MMRPMSFSFLDNILLEVINKLKSINFNLTPYSCFNSISPTPENLKLTVICDNKKYQIFTSNRADSTTTTKKMLNSITEIVPN